MTQKTKISFFLIPLLLLGFLFLPGPVRAFFPVPFASCLLTAVIRFIFEVSVLCVRVVSTVLRWIVMENFIPLSYTDPARNPIIDAGWSVMRDFANMFFVIFLAVIGLATALRIKEYEVQKALPKLIFIALIINFTPVICGLIVDASNILTNFFLREAGAGIELMSIEGEKIFGGFWEILATCLNPFSSVDAEKLFQALYLAYFNLGASFIYLIFIFLFLFRYVAIWMLVIFSPIAFIFYVIPLPAGISLPVIGEPWKGWWRLFLQWCFVGVAAAFCLFLGDKMMQLAPTIEFPEPPIVEGLPQKAWREILEMVLPHGIALLFLGFGALGATQAAAYGANYAIQGAKWVGAAAMGAGAVVGKTAAKGGKRFLREQAPPPIKERLSALAKIKTPLQTTEKEQEMGAKAWPSRFMKWAIRTPITPVFTGLRRLGETALPETELEEIEKAKGEVKKLKAPARILDYFRAADRPGKIAAIHAAYEEKKLKDLIKEGLTEEEIVTTARAAFAVSPEAAKPFMKAFPELAKRMTALAQEEVREKVGISEKDIIEWAEKELPELTKEQIRERIPELISMKITAGLEPGDVEKMNLKYINKEAVHRFWSGREIGAAARTFGREFVDEFMDRAIVRGREWYEQYNPKVLRYLPRAAAQGLGFGEPSRLSDLSPRVISTEEFEPAPPPLAPLKDKLSWATSELAELRGLGEEQLSPEDKERLKALEREIDRLREERKKEVAPPAAPPPRGRPTAPSGRPTTPGAPPSRKPPRARRIY